MTIHPIRDGWFFEADDMWPGVSLGLKVERVLHEEHSGFQHILVFESTAYGRVLVLDGVIQLTEADEHAYQEMLAHVPLFAHPDPRRMLVIGGGDGGVLREAGRHRGLERMDLCEIDPRVIEVARQHLPSLATGFDDPRVRVHHADGARFIEERPGHYDVIVVDSSDPVGPAEALFEEPFYAGLRQALRPGGVIATQGESLFLHPDIVSALLDTGRRLFTHAHYCQTMVPTYPGGSIGLLVASDGVDVRRPARAVPEPMAGTLRYYSAEMHEAAFVLPARFAQ